MSENSHTHRVLHLIVEGFPPKKVEALTESSSEIFPLTETNAREALEKIFAAETVMVWSELKS